MSNTEQRLTKLENQMASIWKSVNKEDYTTEVVKSKPIKKAYIAHDKKSFKRVIRLLEELGGENKVGFSKNGHREGYIYYIKDNNLIGCGTNNDCPQGYTLIDEKDLTTDIPNISIGQTFKHNIFHQVKVTAIEDTSKERFSAVVYSTEESAEAFKTGKVIDCFTSNYSRIIELDLSTKQSNAIVYKEGDSVCVKELDSEETSLEKAKRLYKVGVKFADMFNTDSNIILPGQMYYQCGNSISVNTQNGIKYIQYQGMWAEIIEP